MCSVLIIFSFLLVSVFAFPPDHHFHGHGQHWDDDHHNHHGWHDWHDHHDWNDDSHDFHFGSFPEHNHGHYPIQFPEHGFKSPNQGGHKQTQFQIHQNGNVEEKLEREMMQKLDHELNDKLTHRLEKGIAQIFNNYDNTPLIGGIKGVPNSNIGGSDDRVTAVFREQDSIQNTDSGSFSISNSNERGINENVSARDLNSPDLISNPNNGNFDEIGRASGINNLAQNSGGRNGQTNGFNGIFTQDSTSSSSQSQSRSTSNLIIAGQNNVGQPSQQGGQVLRRNSNEQENNGISIRSGGISSSTNLNLQQAFMAIDDLAN